MLSRKTLLTAVLLVAAAMGATATVLPLTARELSLMIRSGYSTDAVLHELSVRHFAGDFDAATEKQFVAAGAGDQLIEALRSGTYQASASETAAVQKQLDVQRERAEEAEEHAKPMPASEDHAPIRAKAPAQPAPDGLYRLLKDDLVYLHNGVLAPFDDKPLATKKLYLLFFSANWSPAGRKFTSRLIDYYNRVVPEHPEFEIIFFSADRSSFGMETYVTQSRMPWPAVAYDRINSKASVLPKDLVQEIPCLVLADAAGRLISGTKPGDSGGPDKVLADVDRLLGRSNGGVAEHP